MLADFRTPDKRDIARGARGNSCRGMEQCATMLDAMRIGRKGWNTGSAVWVGILFACVGVCVYGASLGNKFVPFDDDYLVMKNPLVEELSPGSIRAAFTTYDPELYIPLTFISYQIDERLGGGMPGMFHVTNLVLHIANAFLVFVLLSLLCESEWVAVFCGLLFLVHPINVEAVSWVSGRKDLLSTFFALTALIAYVRYVQTKKSLSLLLSWELFLLALLAKVMPITLPALLLLIDFWSDRRITKQVLREKVPFLGLSLIFGIIALGGKSVETHSLGAWQWLLLASRSVTFTLQHIVLPLRLHLLYYNNQPLTLLRPDIALSVAFLLGLGVFLLRTRKRYPRLAAGISFFLIALFPTFFNLAKRDETYFSSDRYAYFPLLGLLLLLAWALPLAARNLRMRRTIAAGGAAILAIFAAISIAQTSFWKDGITLLTHELLYAPRSVIALNNRAGEYGRINEYDKALADYTRASAIAPDDVTILDNIAMIHASEGQYPLALDLLNRSLSMDPRAAQTHFALSVVFHFLGRQQDAKDAFSNALALDPSILQKQANPLQ